MCLVEVWLDFGVGLEQEVVKVGSESFTARLEDRNGGFDDISVLYTERNCSCSGKVAGGRGAEVQLQLGGTASARSSTAEHIDG